ncbi:hypothetical protein HEK131_46180 [Streptomyces seoulensis]|nr:hypothetical protein HEK131_46180 [Streptomyces seoulensis]
MSGGLRHPVAALRIEPPLQLVALDHQCTGDQAVPFAQGRVPDVDEEGVTVARRLVCRSRLDAPVAGADPVQQFVDPDRAQCVAAHCQSSGRSTCSSRSTCPVRL